MSTATETVEELAKQEYKYGFVTDVETDSIPVGLNEDVVRLISAKKEEPDWLLEWRLNAFRVWKTMAEPNWHNVEYSPIDYQAISYYAAPKKKLELQSLDEVDPEVRATFDKLGISLDEQKRLSGVAVDAVFDSVSVATTFKDTLANLGIIFCSFSEAVLEHPDVGRSIDPAALSRYMLFDHVATPGTIFRSVRRLPAGSLLTWSAEEDVEVRRYWDLSFPTPDFKNVDEALTTSRATVVVTVQPEPEKHPKGRTLRIPVEAGYPGSHFLVEDEGHKVTVLD